MVKVHLEILKLARLGLPLGMIAKSTGVPAAAIAVILRSPLGAAELVRGA